MMSLPQVFASAGYIPASLCILIVWIASSITGSLFAQAISEIPGNQKFTKNITYATAFRTLVDQNSAIIAERIFILACFIQCSAGIVQASQSLDSFIASYLLGETYGLQLYPSVQLVTWSESLCHNGLNEIDTLQNCVPFFANGPLIVTLGYLIVVCLFLPLGLRNLKETMVVQLISFAFLVIVMVQFNTEFLSVDLKTKVPAFGSDLSQLVGVVLFNFDYVLTLPAWLIEKKIDVEANRVIWSTATFCSILYLTFGFLGARAFGPGSEKMMALLESNEVPVITKWCAALFGICIIGAGYVSLSLSLSLSLSPSHTHPRHAIISSGCRSSL
jgi:amino acid permease